MVWQTEIAAELRRNGARLLTRRGVDAGDADAVLVHAVARRLGPYPRG